jgi:hypothetical protein
VNSIWLLGQLGWALRTGEGKVVERERDATIIGRRERYLGEGICPPSLRISVSFLNTTSHAFSSQSLCSCLSNLSSHVVVSSVPYYASALQHRHKSSSL